MFRDAIEDKLCITVVGMETRV